MVLGRLSHGEPSAHSRISAGLLMGYNGPIQGYRQFLSMSSNGPIRGSRQLLSCVTRAHSMLLAVSLHEQQWAYSRFSAAFSWATIGPFKDIGRFSHEQQWAHSRFSAAFLMCNNGPIRCYRQYLSTRSNGPIQRYRQVFSWATMDPFKDIDSFSHEQQWAHSRFSAAFLMCNNGPIRCYRQFLSMSSNGPIHGSRQVISEGTIGPFKDIGRFAHGLQWTHSRISAVSLHEHQRPHSRFSAASLMCNNGPIRCYWQFLSMSSNGPIQGSRQLSHGQPSAHSRISANFPMGYNGPIQGYRHFSHEQQWAHLMLSAVSLMSSNGPIQGSRQLFSSVTMGLFEVIGRVHVGLSMNFGNTPFP
jgi:hypothetical protein